MTKPLIVMILCYVFLLAIVLSIVIRTRLGVSAKLSLIVATFAVYFFTYDSMRAALGWPVKTDLPEEFMLVSAWVSEPAKKNGTDGSIVLWLVTLEEEKPVSDPRSYRLPYDENLHQRILDSEMRMKQGKLQIGRRTTDPEGSRIFSAGSTESTRMDIELHDLPDPALPEK